MSRTTLDLDASVLRQLRRLAKSAGKSMGEVASELLATALKRTVRDEPEHSFQWKTRPMKARVNLEDKDAVLEALRRA